MFMTKKWVISLLSLFLFLFLSCVPGKKDQRLSQSGFYLGTSCHVTLYGSHNAGLLDQCFKKIERFEKRISRHEPGSFTFQLNKNGVCKADSETEALLDKAMDMAVLSKGRFDPTLGALVSLWDIGGEGVKPPAVREIKKALNTVDYRHLKKDNSSGQAVYTLGLPGMQLDLGGIAKGAAADEISAFLKNKGVQGAIINFGGNIQLVGSKPSGEPWVIGIQSPLQPRGEYLGLLQTGPGAVVTSGVYERFFEYEGRRYHHILDTETGFPVDTGILSLTVLTAKGVDADGLSTALFAMGEEAALAFAETHEDMDVILVKTDKSIRLSSGLAGRFELGDSSYRLLQPLSPPGR